MFRFFDCSGVNLSGTNIIQMDGLSFLRGDKCDFVQIVFRFICFETGRDIRFFRDYPACRQGFNIEVKHLWRDVRNFINLFSVKEVC